MHHMVDCSFTHFRRRENAWNFRPQWKQRTWYSEDDNEEGKLWNIYQINILGREALECKNQLAG